LINIVLAKFAYKIKIFNPIFSVIAISSPSNWRSLIIANTKALKE
jgi:hypothetical protein